MKRCLDTKIRLTINIIFQSFDSFAAEFGVAGWEEKQGSEATCGWRTSSLGGSGIGGRHRRGWVAPTRRAGRRRCSSADLPPQLAGRRWRGGSTFGWVAPREAGWKTSTFLGEAWRRAGSGSTSRRRAG